MVSLPVLSQPAATDDAGRFRDPLGRRIGYLRLSLTKACAMRCTYCRPTTLAHDHDENRLSAEQIEAMVRHLVQRHGLTKVRLTGGDPTSRAELPEIIERLARIAGLEDLAMTTNGLTLPRHAARYARAGLRRLNISLDTLDAERFAALTGVDGLRRVLDGIAAARSAGLGPIKLNTVVVRGQNEQDLPALVRFAVEENLEARFIELMPMGPLAESWARRYVSEARMRRIIDPITRRWIARPHGAESARRYRVQLDDGAWANIGFITPMSCNFCANCNRVRITADGAFYPCLMDKPTGSLAPALAPRFDAIQFDRLLAAGLSRKAPEHPATGHGVMTHLGG